MTRGNKMTSEAREEHRRCQKQASRKRCAAAAAADPVEQTRLRKVHAGASAGSVSRELKAREVKAREVKAREMKARGMVVALAATLAQVSREVKAREMKARGMVVATIALATTTLKSRGAGAEGAEMEAPLAATLAETTQEQLRRQQIMRLGLVVCLLFLMLDNGAKPAGRVAPPASVSYAHGLPLDSTLSQQVRDALEPTQGVGMGEIKPFNATGLFRGAWLARRPSVIGGGSSKGGGVDAGAGVGAGLGVWGAGAGADAGGSVFLQLVSVPLLPLPDISFLYGVLRLYRNTNPAAGGKGVGGMGVGGNVGGVGIAELSLPIQGLVVSSRRQLYLFATPRKAQRLYLQMTPG
ncbi:hypothetical protein B484DRAFT_422709, partial [Ochromonadaceae sp. CCMP2298]